jgi:hypothetical protein
MTQVSSVVQSGDAFFSWQVSQATLTADRRLQTNVDERRAPRWRSDRGSPGNQALRMDPDGEAPRAESGRWERGLRRTTVVSPTWPRTAARSGLHPPGRWLVGRTYPAGSPRTPCLARLQTTTTARPARSTFYRVTTAAVPAIGDGCGRCQHPSGAHRGEVGVLSPPVGRRCVRSNIRWADGL